jgi:hypothetical protein
MKKFVLLYVGTPERSAEVMAGWDKWFGVLGEWLTVETHLDLEKKFPKLILKFWHKTNKQSLDIQLSRLKVWKK